MKSLFKSKITLLAAAGALLLNFLQPLSTGATYVFNIQNLTNNPVLLQTYPDAYGNKLIYTEREQGKGGALTLMLKDLVSGTTYQVNQVAESVTSLHGVIDGNIVVYAISDSPTSTQIVMADVTNPLLPVRHTLTSSNTEKYEVAISGTDVIYTENITGVGNVYHINITNPDVPVVTALTNNVNAMVTFWEPSISGKFVSFSRRTISGSEDYDIIYENITNPSLPEAYTIGGTGHQYGGHFESTTLVYIESDVTYTTATYKKKAWGGAATDISTKSCTASCFTASIDISGENVAYTTENAVYVNSLVGNMEQQIEISDYPSEIKILGDKVYWERVISGVGDREIYGTQLTILPPPSYQNVYRFWNNNGTHFYTASESEKNNVMARWPNIYKYEGVAYTINSNSQTPMTPLYRLWNSNGTHFYTSNYQEAVNAVNRWPAIFRLEGVAYYVSAAPNSRPVFRFWNKNGTHFYTASEAEKNNVIARWPGTFSYEGVAYYLPE